MSSSLQTEPHSLLWEAFRGYISEARLGPYLITSNGNRKQAIQLAQWNIGLSGAVYESLHFFEVVLRNALDVQLSAWNATQLRPSGGFHDPDWLVDPSALLHKLTQQGKDIKAATSRAVKATRGRAAAATHADILAQMSFGAWRFLLPDKSPARTLLWKDALSRAFPHTSRAGRQITKDVAGVHQLRNRVAHLEPLLNTHRVHSNYEAMRRVLAEINPLMEQRFVSTQRITTHIAPQPGRR